ncbi:hypothetical protein G5I_11284 [Acromyrmex echinatior]|uniref:Uncharacterized protein n=1 Tax=Acromyrmex echinatior TaxID=103372 RepID=F4WZ71_ACREC|nr:hypothetical protein G5I_11284 [Acromyrmex echinatior]
MTEPQPVRRVARFASAVLVVGLKLLSARDYSVFASVLRECPVHILRGGGGLGETSGTDGATWRPNRSFNTGFIYCIRQDFPLKDSQTDSFFECRTYHAGLSRLDAVADHGYKSLIYDIKSLVLKACSKVIVEDIHARLYNSLAGIRKVFNAFNVENILVR